MAPPPVLLWFRQDLRLDDHPAWRAACEVGRPVLPVFIWSPEEEGGWAPGGAGRWWLHHALRDLSEQLAGAGLGLVIRRGPAVKALDELLDQTGATGVHWSRRYEPAARAVDAGVEKLLRQRGVEGRAFNASLLWEPWEVATRKGGPYQVFTPFWRALLEMPEPESPRPAPARVRAMASESWPWSLTLDALELEPRVDWAGGLLATWTPTAAGASARLSRFLSEGIDRYETDRDRPDGRGTSELSPYLHWGQISPRRVWHAVRAKCGEGRGVAGLAAGPMCFLKEMAWREFAYHLLHHFPHTPERPLREAYERFPWETNEPALRRWQRGLTGYPIVDAGMRQLWRTGWMHNRVRMIVASFLVKDLLLPWQEGARWFWDTLVDADLASNTLGWQWAGGCGADAAPYFRVFNPVTQGRKFDPEGAYVRRYVPELAALPDACVHAPWEASPMTLREAGVRLGETYPEPMVDHAQARDRALAALARLKER